MAGGSTDNESLIKFPCEFPVKAMAKSIAGIEITVLELIKKHAPEVTEKSLKIKPSSGGKYLGITVIIIATSQQQLDDIYQALTDHTDILMSF